MDFIINDTAEKYNFLIHAYTKMDNHYHFLLEDLEGKVSEIMHLINLRHSKYINYHHNRTGKLFEREFQSKPIETESYFKALVRYIHNNWLEAKQPLNRLNKTLCSYPIYMGEFSPLICFSKDRTMSAFGSQDKLRDFHHEEYVSFNPLVKNAEQAFLAREDLKLLEDDSKVKDKLLIHYMRNINGNSSKEISEFMKHKSQSSIRSIISRLKEDEKRQFDAIILKNGTL